MRQAGVLSLLEGVIESIGGHGDAQRGEVGEDLVTPAWGGRLRWIGLAAFRWRGIHRRLPRARASIDNRWYDVGRWLHRANWDQARLDVDRPVRPAAAWVWPWRRGCGGPPPVRRRRSEQRVPGRREHRRADSGPRAPAVVALAACLGLAWRAVRRGTARRRGRVR